MDCCTLDWFASWPEDALISVANQLLENLNLPQDIQEPMKILAKDVHLHCLEQAQTFDEQFKRKIYNTPKSFLDFLKLYEKAYFLK